MDQARERFVDRLCARLPALDKALFDHLNGLVNEVATHQLMQRRRDTWMHYQSHHADWIERTASAWRKGADARGTEAARRNTPGADPDLNLEGLELVSDDTVENRLIATRMARAIVGTSEAELEAVRQRTKHLEGREIPNDDVLLPEGTCIAIVDQWLASGLSREELEVVFEPMQQAVAEAARPAYEAVTALYDAQGVPSVAALRSQARRPASAGGTGDRYGHSSGSVGLSGYSSGGSELASARAPMTAPGLPGMRAPSAPAYGWTPLEQARQRAEHVMVELQHLLAQSGSGFSPIQAPPATAALTQALAAMRVAGAEGYASGLSPYATVQGYSPQLVLQVASEVRERAVELKKKAGTAAEKAIIEVVALMFQSILDEDRIPPSVRVWFARLQVPVLRVALAEPEFFNDINHPARKLIDRMGSCVLGFDANAINGSALEGEIRRIVQVVEQYPETGHKVFQIVHDEFEKFLAASLTQTQKTSRIVSVAQQMEQKETLTVQYTIELRTMLRDLAVRDEIRDFLYKTWTEVLAVSAVRDGAQHADTVAYKRVAADLVWASSAKPSRAERTQVIQALPGIIERLRGGLTLVGVVGEPQDAQIKVLTDTLADAFLSKTATIAQARIDALAKRLEHLEDFITDESLGDIALDAENIEILLGIDASAIHVMADTGAPVQEQALEWVQAMPLGTWYALDHNGAAERVQYVWHSERKQLHLFASPGGQSYLFQMRRLAAYLQARLLALQEEEALTLRATRDALSKLSANPERLLG
ncbi:MAG: DUF1631 family protein [Comamonadaceae bacterium]|nr:DUF1631 family protein [Comamonadaceae bacterium]